MDAFSNTLEPVQFRLGLLNSQDFEAVGGWRWAMVAAFMLGKSTDTADQGFLLLLLLFVIQRAGLSAYH